MADICTDNRFELIKKYKDKLIEATNIESDEDEMKVIDNILFRCWQMGWLDRLESIDDPVVRCKDCRYGITAHGISNGWVLCSKPYTERGNAMHRTNWFCADGERKEGR